MGNVLTRDDWNDLIRNVNDTLENPPGDSGCDPVDPLDEVEPNHIWAKSDIREVQDAIKQTCDTITFDEIPDRWEQSIIDDINDSLDDAWCDCEEECQDECDNAGDPEFTEFTVTTSGCQQIDIGGTDQELVARQVMEDAQTLGAHAAEGAEEYRTKWSLFCYTKWLIDHCLQKKVDTLTDELDTAQQTAEDECGKPHNEAACTAAQDKVTKIQQDLAKAQADLDKANGDKSRYEGEANAGKDQCNSFAAQCWAKLQSWDNCGNSENFCSRISDVPWPACVCDDFPSWQSADPGRCASSWRFIYYRFIDGNGNVYNMTQYIFGGNYSPNGTPYSARSGGSQAGWCKYYCASNNCGYTMAHPDIFHCDKSGTNFFRLVKTPPVHQGQNCQPSRKCPAGPDGG